MAKAKAEAADTGMKKTEMVEAALSALGDTAAPGDIQPWIQTKFNVEIDRQMISSYASTIRKKKRTAAGESGKVAVGGGSLGVKDVTLLKDLIDRLGAAELTGLIKVLAK
jgi:hypothetical protein